MTCYLSYLMINGINKPNLDCIQLWLGFLIFKKINLSIYL
ncbi:hypothetical protein AO373_0086 [Moraxella catarrhalis]|nr:hypothetical protein AO381_0311 [Moraxella catarrhalis]OAV06932.1 hypothetical protein AO379_0426 [Moraxella catarrhalis]OAV21028.1 hypothetical protein AO373_0086 [Moraxella catarrhalis]OAV38044.1 hypothetical protein AO364_0189 [Moraxella catarrhalis]